VTAHAVAVIGVRGGVAKTAVGDAIGRRAGAAGVPAVVCKPEAIRHDLVTALDGRVYPGDLRYLVEAAPQVSPADIVPIVVRPISGPAEVPPNHSLDRRVEVYVAGELAAVTTLASYIARVDHYARLVMASLDRLRAAGVLPVIVGSGASTELHLGGHGPLSMRIVSAVSGPVVLVADARAGGVLASLTGTLALLPEKIRSRVTGIVLTRAGQPGRPSLIRGFGTTLTELTGLPLLGTVSCPPDPFPVDRQPPPGERLPDSALPGLRLQALGKPFSDE